MHASRPATPGEVLVALGHSVRLEILGLLLKGERCVCEITPHFKQERSVVSRHLSILENAGVVRSRKVGRRVFYQIADDRIVTLLNVLLDIFEKPGKGKSVGPSSGLACCLPAPRKETDGPK